MRKECVCFTGHRIIPNESEVAQRLKVAVTDQIANGYSIFNAGGAQGFDTLAAEAVLSLKLQYPHIRLHLMLPCHGQSKPKERRYAVYGKIRTEKGTLHSQSC